MKKTIVLNGKTYIALDDVQASTADDTRYEELVEIINQEYKDAKYLYNDMKQQELSFGTIEAEGYVRALRIILSQIENIEEWHNINLASNRK